MEPERARDLLARERSRIEQALGADEADSEDLRAELAAVERAEARLQDGTYGLSVLSGEPIPEPRLEARPTAEMTVEEQQRQDQ